MEKMFLKYSEVFRQIEMLLKVRDIVFVAIDGNSAAGKTTLAALLSSTYDCNVFHMDDYFLKPELKTEERKREIGGNIDYERFELEIVAGLQGGVGFSYHPYDCSENMLRTAIPVTPQKLNIIEGSYSMHPYFSMNYDLKIFLALGEEEQRTRIRQRAESALWKMFFDVWIPQENRYFQKMKIKEQCDLVYSTANHRLS